MKINGLKPTMALLRFNLDWHAQVIKDALVRYKIFLLFFILTLVPTVSGLNYILTLPTKCLLSRNATSLQYVISLSTYLSIGLLWLALQKNIISKQPWEKYLGTLPLTNIQKIICQTTTLLVVDGIIWIPLILAAYGQLISNGVNTLIVICKVLTYVALVILFQMLFLFLGRINLSKRIKITRARKNSNIKLSKNFAFNRIQIKNLYENWTDLAIQTISIIAVYSIAFCIIKYAQNNTLIISSLLLFNAAIISNLFVKLSTQRNQLLPYLISLPILKIEMFIKDLTVTGICLVTINALIFITEIFSHPNQLKASVIITTFIMPIILLCLSYFPQLYFKKYGFILSLIIMSFFIWINYSLITITQGE